MFLSEIARLGRPSDRNVVSCASLDSTSTHLVGLVRKGERPGTVVIAGSQRSGRGRQGRKWHSPPSGNLYLSLAVSLRSFIEKSIRFVPLAAGVAAVDTARGLGADRAEIKWPNDVLVEGLKLAGILCEVPDLSKRPLVIVVGLGLNMFSARLPEEIEATATSLAACGGSAPSIEIAAASWVAAVEQWIERLDSGDTSGILDSWRMRAEVFGRRVRVDGIVGNTVDLDADGRLLVQKDNGEIKAVAGGAVEGM